MRIWGVACAALAIAGTAAARASHAPAEPAPPSEVMLLHGLAKDVSPDRMEADVVKLASFGTRHTASQTGSETRGIGAARRWIHGEFTRISKSCGGCLEVLAVSETISGEPRIPDAVEVVNVLAIQRGSLDPDRMVMISGDIDSRVSDVMDAVSDSPGANDNASGLAATLEAARVLSQHEFPGTIVYAALAGEEQGQFGGRIVANYAKKNGWRLKAVLNNDSIGNIEGIDGVIGNTTVRIFSEGIRAAETPLEAEMRRYIGGDVDSASRNLARYIGCMAHEYIPNLDTIMVYRADRFGRGGHQLPFSAAGFPAVRITEASEHYHRQHQDLRVKDGRPYGDVIEGVDFDYAAKITALDVVTLAGLALAPPFPAGVRIRGVAKPSTTLKWKKAKGKRAANLAGYRVYWRLTAEPQWTHSRYVGNVNAYTFENIVIDNYFFGVASVAKDGSESAIVFPGPAGSFGN